ncbi:MAG: helix-turn-helix domain-containing protein [Spirochaetaceae bacterium]|nr:helix-turn-helix domain-containing protein [Spirochaetaceae bacterium]
MIEKMKKTDVKTTGGRIKLLREQLGLSQRAFCKLLSLSGGYIAGIEVGLRTVNDRLIKLIVSEFNVSKDWLLTGEGQMFDVKTTDERTTRLVALFNDMPPKYQDVIFGVIDVLRNTKNDT